MSAMDLTDIRLDGQMALTRAADGDAPVCTGADLFIQSLRLEALTQPGDLFYDEDYGWGLLDFIHSEDSEITRLEIEQRVVAGLRKREEIVPGSADARAAFVNGKLSIRATFRLAGEDAIRSLTLSVGDGGMEEAEI